MKKRTLGVLVLVLLVSSLVLAQTEDCGFFCKLSNWWSEFRGEENVVMDVE